MDLCRNYCAVEDFDALVNATSLIVTEYKVEDLSEESVVSWVGLA